MNNLLGVAFYLASFVAVGAASFFLYQRDLLGGWFLIAVYATTTLWSHLVSTLWPAEKYREPRGALVKLLPLAIIDFVSNHFVVRVLCLALVAWILSVLPASNPSVFAEVPVVVLTFMCLVVFEALAYGQHWVMHRVSWLWRNVHSVHHEPRAFGSSLIFRLHYIEYFIVQITRVLVLNLAQIDPRVIVMVIAITMCGAFMQHSSTCLRFGWLNYIVLTPQVHVWHHDQDSRVNYGAGIFSIFDLLAGTFCYRPGHEPRPGVADVVEVRTIAEILTCQPPHAAPLEPSPAQSAP